MKPNKLFLSKTIIILATLLLSTTAWAHATASHSVPEDGAVLSEPPTEVTIQFSGPAKLISLTITDHDGEATEIDVSNASSVDGLATVSIPVLQANSYRVIWRALGLDGHATTGRFGFVISSSSK